MLANVPLSWVNNHNLMENTGNFIFKDDRPVWFVAFNDQVEGPFTPFEIYQKVKKGAFSIVDYACRSGGKSKAWKRLYEFEDFKFMAPKSPGKRLITPQVKASSRVKKVPPAPPKEEAPRRADRDWYLHYGGSQYGPFTMDEVQRNLKIGKIHGKVHAWKESLASWTRLEDLSDFLDSCHAAHQVRASKRPSSKKNPVELEDRRRDPRKPLVARIILTDESTVVMGVCRDISIGGMQVLTTKVPGDPGDRIMINVSPSSPEHGVEPFTAEGIIVRVLEDSCGFSFRFNKLTDQASRSIKRYIEFTEHRHS